MKALNENKINVASIMRLNKLLPRIFPMQRLGLSKITVEVILVKSSGSEVTAESTTPPKKAPERADFFSMRSTYLEALLEQKIINAARTT